MRVWDRRVDQKGAAAVVAEGDVVGPMLAARYAVRTIKFAQHRAVNLQCLIASTSVANILSSDSGIRSPQRVFRS
ncbi:hypothetical protein BER93_06165 [Xanthomonas fragariae]|nr:hypothetical protein BER92_06155 [Xanthomonas fragariae]AOD17775.1 hypothetical protein BER93_06165 [Xanthomonas fragariae]